ncbi:cellulose binding domain-containing protein [Catellatospora coxensis]|nr:cellulose binding domain-containing protein [Catellatospora coxensis]
MRPRWPHAALTLLVAAAMSLTPAPAAHAAADTTAPTAPGTPSFTQVTPYAVTLSWSPSADDVGVADYLVRRTLPTGGVWVDSTPGTTTTITIRDLTPNNQYTFSIVATDAAGNTSAASAAAGVRTLRHTAGTMCSIAFRPVSSGGGSFQSQLDMTNLTPGVWQEWTLAFTLAPGQQVRPEWGFQQNGTRWSQTFVSLWSSGAGPVQPGGTRSVTFTGSYTGDNPPPTEFTINDHPCAVTGVPNTPPTAPGTPVASGLTETSVVLTWTPSTDDVGVDHYEVWRQYTDYVIRVASPTTATATVTGLPRGSVNRFYVVAFDAAGNRSTPSGVLTVTTLPGDLEPPGPVFSLAASEITDSSVRLSWQGPMWGDFALFRIYRSQGGGPLAPVATTTARTIVVTGLSPATTYGFAVAAVDAAGNQSPPSQPPLPVTTTGVPTPPACTVTYRVTSQWAGAFNADVRITNTGPAAITGWTLRWTYAGTQQITNLWNGAHTQTGAAVQVANLGHNATIGAGGGSQSFGFQAGWNGSNPSPTTFTLNGLPCLTG